MALAQQELQEIVDSGALAPSGDNLQPWTVEWRQDVLHVKVDPSRDRSLYNFEGRASLIALGAMVENMVIAAREQGRLTRVELSPSADGLLVSALLRFDPLDSGLKPDQLFQSIKRRVTNRRPFGPVPVPPEVLQALRRAVPADGTVELRFIEDARHIRQLATAASLNDRLLFEMRPLHDPFFESVRWTNQEAETTRDGLFVETLELGPTAPGFKAMKSWRFARACAGLGLTRLAPNHSFGTFVRSPVLGFLQMSTATPQAFLDGGRVLQRIWLTATANGLSFQPMAGMLYLLNYLAPRAAATLSAATRAVIERSDGLFRQTLPLADGKGAIMLFRIGFAEAPSASSLRRPIRLAEGAFGTVAKF